jgi:quinate dehydrogenase (quinone)
MPIPNAPLSLPARLWLLLLSLIIGAAGLFMTVFGYRLVLLQGSAYFVVCGVVLLLCAVQLIRTRSSGVTLFALAYTGSVGWALMDVGVAFWPLMSRLQLLTVLMILVVLVLPALRRIERRTPLKTTAYSCACLLTLASLVAAGSMFQPHAQIQARAQVPPRIPVAAGQEQTTWQHYGNTPGASRFVALDQINSDNVQRLQVAWTYHTGDIPISPTGNGAEDETTPLQVGQQLFICTPHNNVIALRSATGEQLWKTEINAQQKTWMRCRGLAYFDVDQALQQPGAAGATAVALPQPPTGALCRQRILLNSIEAELIALDAHTGQFCPGFGNNGRVDLKAGIGKGVESNQYSLTSAPTLAGTTLVVGGRVADNASTDMPGGVIRGYDVMTGGLRWAFDPGNPQTHLLPAPGQTYSRSTPNVWAPMSYDPDSNTVFLPVGSAAIDFYGVQHHPLDRQYGASLLALDASTGREKWDFQTVHDDLWDFDVPMPPSLIDLPQPDGSSTPALIFGTKAGQLFVLDRLTGKPLTAVAEQPVPAGDIPGETYSPTQPLSVGMPQIGTRTLGEADMWGITPFDQLLCRIQFKALRYDGLFTPPGTETTLNLPGSLGGMNWGGLSTDPTRQYVFVNDMRVGLEVQLVAQAAKVEGKKPPRALQGTPYAISVKRRFLSPLGIPCQAPPFGTLTAIDLKTRQIAWQAPVGTVQDTGPLGIKMHLPIPIGMPTLGGTLATQGGLLFIAATQDHYLHAFDSGNGEQLWKGRLPVGSQGTPISYRDPATGKQYVLITAGGGRGSPDRGDYVIAYALPD